MLSCISDASFEMYAINHLIIKTLQATASSNVDKAVSIGKFLSKSSIWTPNVNCKLSVLSKAGQEGIVTNKKDVRIAVQQVMKILYLGKADASGEFKEVSKASSVTKSSVMPDYYSDLDIFLQGRLFEHAVIVSVSKWKSKNFHKADLVLYSSDLNSCNFSLKLGKCLAEDSTTIYIECGNLSKRGVKRLLVILKEFKNNFDSRVIIILVSEKTVNESIAPMSEIDFGSTDHESKKIKLDKKPRESIEKKQQVNEKIEDLEMSLIEAKYSKVNDNVGFNKDLEVETVESPNCSLNLDGLVLEKERLERELKVAWVEHEKMNHELDKIKLEQERSKLSQKEVDSELCDLKSKNRSLTLEKDHIKLEQERLEQDFGSLKLKVENLKPEIEHLKTEQEFWQQENLNLKQDNVSLQQEHSSLKQELASMKQEHDSLQQEHRSLNQENGSLKQKQDEFKQEHSSLMQELGSLKEDHGKLRQEHGSLKQENSILIQKLGMYKLESSSKTGDLRHQATQTDNLTKNEVQVNETEGIHKSDLIKLCDIIKKNQRIMINASAPEIIRKSIPKLHFKAETLKAVDGNVIFSVNILKGDIIQDFRGLLAFEGQGENTKLAKINAFDVFIRNVLNCVADL